MFDATSRLTFLGRCDMVVIGSNPENADMDNPRGEIWGYAPYVLAEDAKGYRRVQSIGKPHRYPVDAERIAETVASRLQSRFDCLGKLPVGFERWTETTPCYGSDAYDEMDQGAIDAAIEQREAYERY